MKKIVMVDGNNLLFRSYYATAYSGNLMQNSKGFPTNGLFGFIHMIKKIIKEENPAYMLVAFDIGKTFRHEMFDNYKEDRIKMPEDLAKQFPVAKEILANMGIKAYEIDNYEADDIIGTFAKFCDDNQDFVGTIVSSDKDLLQLISKQVDIKLLKQKDFIRYDLESFFEAFAIAPEKIIDLKALQGDSSDNIPGVSGIGEKTALKLLKEHGSLDGIYENIEKISGKLKEKLLNDRDNAYLSYRLAKIETSVPLKISIDDLLIKPVNEAKLTAILKELEFFSMIEKSEKVDFKTKIIKDVDQLPTLKEAAIFLELDHNNYHQAQIIGMSVFGDKENYFVKKELIAKSLAKINHKFVYDYKRTYVALKKMAVDLEKVDFDIMLAAYLLNYNLKDEISYLAKQFGCDVLEKNDDYINAVLKAKFIFEITKDLETELKKENMLDLKKEVELPLAQVLGEMEYQGVNVDKKVLIDMGDEIKAKIAILSNEIYNLAGEEFNISSPQQLGRILFDKLALKHGKKNKTGYSTAVDVLEKLHDQHPIIDKLLEYRILTKLHSTYIEGLLNTIKAGKIHTIYQQALTRTGRLSSIEPNLQNIPIRYEYGRLIRKAFVPSNDCLMLAADYSQIELRVLAHLSKVESLIKAFKNNEDIHTKTAQDIFQVEIINSNMRRIAKAVNFGIIYGMSEYGLSKNLNISIGEAKSFIDKYFENYPGVKNFMAETILAAKKNGYVTTLYNRKRKIPELNNTNYMIKKQGERMALNTPIQGTSADILKMAMIEIFQAFQKNNLQSKMILQVHDELVFDVCNQEKAKVSEIVQKVMENIVTLEVPLKVEIATGENWYNTK